MVLHASVHERAQHLAERGLGLGVGLVAGATVAVRVQMTVAVRVEHAILQLLVPFALEHGLALDVDGFGRVPPQHGRTAAAKQEREKRQDHAPGGGCAKNHLQILGEHLRHRRKVVARPPRLRASQQPRHDRHRAERGRVAIRTVFTDRFTCGLPPPLELPLSVRHCPCLITIAKSQN